MVDICNIDFTDSINDALQGDSRAFTFLYNQTYAYFRSIVTKQIGADERTDDVMQEIYLTIFESLSSLQNPQAFLSWGARIARNTAINEFKRQNALKNSQIDYISPIKESEDELSLDEFEASAYDREINPEAAIDAQETSRLMNEILDALPASQRICIVLWSENRTYQEIADDIGLPLNTVKSNIRYAKKKVKVKVEALAAQGTKLYGMAPLPFFLWLLKKYDISILSTKDIKPDVRILQMTLDKLYRKHLEWKPNDGKKGPDAESGSDTGETADESADSYAGESDAETAEDAGNACDSDGADEGPEDFREGGETKSSGTSGNGNAGTAAGTAAKTAAAGGAARKILIIVCILIVGSAVVWLVISNLNTNTDVDEEEVSEAEVDPDPETETEISVYESADADVEETEDSISDAERYAEILDFFYAGISDQWSHSNNNILEYVEYYDANFIYGLPSDWEGDDFVELKEDASYELSYMWIHDNGFLRCSLSEIGYAFVDLDGNGISELLIGINTSSAAAWWGDAYAIMDLYTWSDGEIIHLCSSWERGFFQLSNDGTIAEETSDSAYTNYYYFYDLNELTNELEIKEAVIYDAWDETENPWYYGTAAEVSACESVSEAQAQEILGSYTYASFDLTMFDSYVPTSK